MPNPNLNIIIEENVPFVRGLADAYANVRYLAPEAIDADAVRDADALIIRTRTRCDHNLLDRSRCKLIATATIGTDHIDLPYCQARGITVVNAPGCNAPAVAQYVFASLLAVINRPLADLTIGIVGVGHVGSIVANWARSLEMKVMLCDPPRSRREGSRDWYGLDEIAAKADIITFHTPLTRTGEDRTFHLVDADFIGKLRRTPIIINSARGPIVDTQALVEGIRRGKTGPVVIDCWENEPDIDPTLLHLAAIATPHIAGYSRQGKIRASQAALDAVTTMFMLPRLTVAEAMPPAPARAVSVADIMESYDPQADTAVLKDSASTFEYQRNHYALRDEVAERR